MKILLYHLLIFSTFSLLISCGRNQEEINAEAQELFEHNKEELKITTDDACAEKRAAYVSLYKDSLSKINTKEEAPVGDE